MLFARCGVIDFVEKLFIAAASPTLAPLAVPLLTTPSPGGGAVPPTCVAQNIVQSVVEVRA